VYKGPRLPWRQIACHRSEPNRRHHIPNRSAQMTNWAAYDIALRHRGSLTVG